MKELSAFKATSGLAINSQAIVNKYPLQEQGMSIIQILDLSKKSITEGCSSILNTFVESGSKVPYNVSGQSIIFNSIT